MTRRLLAAVAIALAGLALGVAPALARKAKVVVSHHFTGSEMAEPKFTATSGQEFVFKPFTISCEKAKSAKTGAATSFPAESILTEVKFSGCEATAELHGLGEHELKARFESPVSIDYHANGFVEIGSGGTISEGKLTGAGSIEIALSGQFRCTIDVEAGTYPAAAANNPNKLYEAAIFTPEEVKIEKGKKSFTKKRLAVKNAFTRLPYAFEGEFCEAFAKTEGKAGSYSGTLQAELPKFGSLGWE